MPDRRYIAINKHGYRKEKKNKEQTWKNHAKVLQTKNVEISWNLSQSYKYISIFIWNMQDQNTQNKHNNQGYARNQQTRQNVTSNIDSLQLNNELDDIGTYVLEDDIQF